MIADLHYSVTCREKVVEEFPSQCSKFLFRSPSSRHPCRDYSGVSAATTAKIGDRPRGGPSSPLYRLAASLRRQLMPVLQAQSRL